MRTKPNYPIGVICGRYRAGTGVTQRELAKRTGAKSPNIAAFERGHSPNITHLRHYLTLDPNSPREKVFIDELVECLRNGNWGE